VALVGYSSTGHFVAPAAGDALWLLARAMATVSTEEQVVIQHGVHSASDVHAWPAWLDAVQLGASSPSMITLTPPSGASVLVVDWLGGGTLADAMASELVLAPSGPMTLSIPTAPFIARGARVRVIDVTGVTSGALDLAVFDAHVQRYTDVTLQFP
jgi:hypothetical protein